MARLGFTVWLACACAVVGLASPARASRGEAWHRALQAGRWLERRGLRTRPVASGRLRPGEHIELALPLAGPGDRAVVVACRDARDLEVTVVDADGTVLPDRAERIGVGWSVRLRSARGALRVTLRRAPPEGAHLVVVLGTTAR